MAKSRGGLPLLGTTITRQAGLQPAKKYLTGSWTNAQNGKVLKIDFLDYRDNQSF
jgi:hypothetical protein